MTLQLSMDALWPEESTCSQEVSRAKTSRRRAKAKASEESEADSGLSCSELSKSADPIGSLLKTCLLSVLEEQTLFSQGLKKQATPAGRSWWVLTISALRTHAREGTHT